MGHRPDHRYCHIARAQGHSVASGYRRTSHSVDAVCRQRVRIRSNVQPGGCRARRDYTRRATAPHRRHIRCGQRSHHASRMAHHSYMRPAALYPVWVRRENQPQCHPVCYHGTARHRHVVRPGGQAAVSSARSRRPASRAAPARVPSDWWPVGRAQCVAGCSSTRCN